MTRSRLFAMLTFGICAGSALATLGLLGVGMGGSTPGDHAGVGRWGGAGYVIAALAFGIVGSVLVARVPGNRVGWIIALTGDAIAVGDVTFQYADQVLFGPLAGLPGGQIATWIPGISLAPTFGLIALALLVFPDGRLPSPRWRTALVPPLAGSAMIATGYALRPGSMDPPFASISNPFGVPGTADLMDGFIGTGYILTGIGMLLAAAAMLRRRQHASVVERQQLKWVAFAATVVGGVIAIDIASYLVDVQGVNEARDALLGIAISAFPIAAGMAILRYRLYDIDLVINRALVYGALTAILAGFYLGAVLLLGLVLNPVAGSSGLSIAASTLAVAALFRPARSRVQETVDRRFFRQKYDAAQTLAQFGTHLRDQVDLDDIGIDLIAVVADTVQPSHASLWLRAQGAQQ